MSETNKQTKKEDTTELIDTQHSKLEGEIKVLAFVVDAIKKKAQFVNVAAAYSLLQQMNAIFADYNPWKEQVKPLEHFLMKEKQRAQNFSSQLHNYPNDVQMADAISSINGKDKAIDERQKWMGVCKYVIARCGYPHDLKMCCKKLARLPYMEKLEFPCDYENVRKLATCGFYYENYDSWPAYEPKKSEKKYFDSCYDVALELERKIEQGIF